MEVSPGVMKHVLWSNVRLMLPDIYAVQPPGFKPSGPAGGFRTLPIYQQIRLQSERLATLSLVNRKLQNHGNMYKCCHFVVGRAVQLDTTIERSSDTRELAADRSKSEGCYAFHGTKVQDRDEYRVNFYILRSNFREKRQRCPLWSSKDVSEIIVPNTTSTLSNYHICCSKRN
jgi:hypothetical protein